MRLSLIPAILLLAAPAFAQDDPPPQPPPANTTVLLPPPTATPTQDDDPAPIRLSAIIAEAAAVQRRGRIAEAVLGIFAGGGGVGTGAALIAMAKPPNQEAMQAIGGIAIGFGGLTVITSVLDLFSRRGLERLDDAYAPIAHDTRIPAAKRLAEGEQALEAFAQAGKTSRIVSGVTSIIIGAALGIAAGPIVFGTIPNTNPPSNAETLRAYLGIGLGLSAFLILASGITTIVVRRTEAEQLWNMWLAGTGRPTSRLLPFITPSGIGATF